MPVTERLDATVKFIGAPTNVFKSYLVDDSFPENGVAVAQTCLRTQNLYSPTDSNESPNRCSVIPMMGFAANSTDANRVAQDAADYFLSLPFELRDRMVVWVSSTDPDLLDLCRNEFSCFTVEIDTQPLERYRHVYGVEGLNGRNLNFGIRTDSGRVDQIGNLVVIEWHGRPRAVEWGISLPMLLSLCYDKPHPICATPVAEYLRPGTPTDVWLADSLAIAQLLLSEGLRPRGRGRNLVLRMALWRTAELLEASSFKLSDIDDTLRRLGLLDGDPASVELADRVTRYIERCAELSTNQAAGLPDYGISLSRIL